MLSFGLSTALLLAACLFKTSVVSTETVVTCDSLGNVHRLGCDHGVIRVQSALYGRTNRETCSRARPRRQLVNTQCSQNGTVDVIKTRCDGKKVCAFNTNVLRTSDPCRGIFKYVETNFTCFPAYRVVACEGSVARLFCGVGQVIFIYGAHYGRSDRTTCSFGRPSTQLQNVSCSSRTSNTVAAQRCNGKNNCTLSATNFNFRDSCFGTYKYLEVAYTCDYPLFTSEESSQESSEMHAE